MENKYVINYTERVNSKKLLVFKKTYVNKKQTFTSAKSAIEFHKEIYNDSNIDRISIFKNNIKISFIELMADSTYEQTVANARKLKKISEVVEPDNRKTDGLFDVVGVDTHDFIYVHDMENDKRLVTIIIHKDTRITELAIIDIERTMFLLDTCLDFNVAFKMLDEALPGFKFFDLNDIISIVDGCFHICTEKNIVRVHDIL